IDSYAEVVLTQEGSAAGGLVGDNSNAGTIQTSFAMGDVNSGLDTPAGGLVGELDGGAVTDSYATGDITVSAPYYVGGLIGTEDRGGLFPPTAKNNYSTGVVPPPKLHKASGGSIGYNFGKKENTNLYWDTMTSGTELGVGRGDSGGVTGLTTAQLQSGLPAGFDPKIWAENPNINNGFPYLIHNPPPK
ncbi:MAG TPA: GLUG motif-containing protein, partial [Rhizomicrobium sp.]